jgi:C_GCAxxG_C_C family probable redox protein
MPTDAIEVAAALDNFDQGFNCAQAVLAAFASRHGLSREHALKVACSFGSGMMRGETCGAVTGSLMVIGLAHGRCRADDMQARSKTYALAQAFQDRFEKMHGTCDCQELLGLDPTTPEGRKAALDRGLFETRCPTFVRSAVGILLDLVYAQRQETAAP